MNVNRLLVSFKSPVLISLMVWIALSFSARNSLAQKEMRTYYDNKKQHIQEIFFVEKENEQEYIGKYQRFYESGGVMLEGNFEEGEKAGVFTEYHENGKPARRMSYVNGLGMDRYKFLTKMENLFKRPITKMTSLPTVFSFISTMAQ
jgi:antitoxin component YwqK of YwqJK toxin-antitoxin module